MRTRKNVQDSDGTLLVGQYRSGGSALTARIAREAGKPLFHLAYVPNLGIVPTERIEEFRYWLERYNIHVLNLAGNRDSNSPWDSRVNALVFACRIGHNQGYLMWLSTSGYPNVAPSNSMILSRYRLWKYTAHKQLFLSERDGFGFNEIVL